jgi:acetoin utilization deacetylase AcuC-like enzyme
MTCAFITHEDCMRHAPDLLHPENPARLKAVLESVRKHRPENLSFVDAPLATREHLEMAHDHDYVTSTLEAFPSDGRVKFDIDTLADNGTLNASLRSVGGAVHAVDLVLGGKASRAFVATRPPGHHAESNRAMGFCFFANVAIAAKYAIHKHGLERVAIVDFDVHHGNGTQHILWDEPRTLFISTHQAKNWPGTGGVEETGAHNNVLNLPLKAKTGSLDMREAYETSVFPRLRSFEPQLLILSAGFDAHRMDKMSKLLWTGKDYAWLTRSLIDATAPFTEGRTVSCLEGGYDIPSLVEGLGFHLGELAAPLSGT